jgi:autotransporter adhesin
MFARKAAALAFATTALCLMAPPASADPSPACNNSTRSGVTLPETTLECGSNASAAGDEATAIGTSATAQQVGTAVGTGATAGPGSTVVGAFSKTTAQNATVLGSQAQATADNSVALGAHSLANEANTVSVGSAGNERRITNVAAGVNATDAANVGQVQAAHAAVSQLGAQHDSRLDVLEALALNVQVDLRQLDRKLAGSTATAIAMGGATFLPGKSVNITGNVATYDGAVAGSLQIGALVRENWAVNAGVATNFNKSGKIGARAGFTLGW